MEPMLKMMGAISVINYAMDYGFIIFIWTFALLMPPIVGGAFRAEGDIKRATVPIALAAIINMILDPIFIYVLGMGIKGAALATVLGPLISLFLMFYWIFVKKDTYLSYNFKDFHNELKMYKDILNVNDEVYSTEFVATVWNNIGITYTKQFLFEDACRCFKTACDINRQEDYFDNMVCAAIFSANDNFIEDIVAQYQITEAMMD